MFPPDGRRYVLTPRGERDPITGEEKDPITGWEEKKGPHVTTRREKICQVSTGREKICSPSSQTIKMLPINGKDISHIPRDGAYPYGTIGSYIETGCNDDDRYIRRYTQSFYVFMSDRCCLLARINYSCYCFLITRLVTKNSPPSTPIRRPTICERLCSPCYHQMRERRTRSIQTPFNIIPRSISYP